MCGGSHDVIDENMHFRCHFKIAQGIQFGSILFDFGVIARDVHRIQTVFRLDISLLIKFA